MVAPPRSMPDGSPDEETGFHRGAAHFGLGDATPDSVVRPRQCIDV
jgi:hypothetical protein